MQLNRNTELIVPRCAIFYWLEASFRPACTQGRRLYKVPGYRSWVVLWSCWSSACHKTTAMSSQSLHHSLPGSSSSSRSFFQKDSRERLSLISWMLGNLDFLLLHLSDICVPLKLLVPMFFPWGLCRHCRSPFQSLLLMWEKLRLVDCFVILGRIVFCFTADGFFDKLWRQLAFEDISRLITVLIFF